MTYIELINEFWKQDRLDPTHALDAKFYFYLLDECNKRTWINPFELQSRIIEISLLITRKTIGEVRNRLKQRGLIDFVSATNKPTIYRICNVEDSPDNCLSNCFSQVTIKKQSKVQSGNTSGYNSETYIEDYRLKTDIKEKPPKGGKKKNLSPLEQIEKLKSETQNDAYRKFLGWLPEKAPYVSSSLQPMNEIEFEKLKAAYGSQTIVENILSLENRKDLRKRYVSMYRTLLNWCKNGYNK